MSANLLFGRDLPAHAAPRRHPLSNAVNHYVPRNTSPLKPSTAIPEAGQYEQFQPPKPPASPPLPRQNTKTAPPSPPRVISDKLHSQDFVRVGLLGEGGFARVYEVKDSQANRLACKVITKSSLKTKKAKTKLYAEIKIHRSLNHPNIVSFQDCFEDLSYVYMTLELCPNGSLMDLLRCRRRFTEPEARFFMVQLIGACHYMHSHSVIHRDLKLGNIFLDEEMNIKVGDFGLAALIESEGERKKTICGTPNYIAPEVLFDTANGHSFEVDTWSIGVILYTFVIGRPPFQTKDVKAIYKRIRNNDYEFPLEREVSHAAKALIQLILTPDPTARPTLHEILDHKWFTGGEPVPSYLPTTVHDSPPDFGHVTREMAARNLRRLRRAAMLDEDQQSAISVPASGSGQNLAATGAAGAIKGGRTGALAQQEREFQNAVQPGSPISALLSSARQPLLTGTAPRGEEPLIRRLQAVARERERGSPVKASWGRKDMCPSPREDKVDEEEEERESRKRELEAQKARIVAQMVPSRPESALGVVADAEDRGEEREDEGRAGERDNVGPVARRGIPRTESARDRLEDVGPSREGDASGGPALRQNGFDAAAATLTAAFEAKSAGEVYYDPRDDGSLPNEKVFIVSWVDYCNKYGMGYAFTDGSVGVHFNDSTTLVLSPDKQHFDYITSRRQGSVYVRKYYTVTEYPEDLKSKVYLLKHFEKYIVERLYGEYEYTFTDKERIKGMDFVQKYLRMKHVIVFKMSHDALQFNFYDHSKMVLSSHGLMVTHIDKNYHRTQWRLSEIMELALSPPDDPDEAKFAGKLVEKLKYCRDVLRSIRKASESQSHAIEGSSSKNGRGTAR